MARALLTSITLADVDRRFPRRVWRMEPRNAGKKWTASEEAQFRREARHMPAREIARRHGRTEVAIKDKALQLGLSLAPKNPSRKARA
jgi:hypothetical protein